MKSGTPRSHKNEVVVYVCETCGKRYPRKHPALCHVRKCTAPRPPPVNGHECLVENCGRVFATKSGFSQHERHEHPVVRNAVRAGGIARGDVQSPRRRALRVFTEAEEDLMLRLELRFRNERNVASLMTEFLPGKTNKQIRDKRNIAAYKRRLEELFAVNIEEEAEPEEVEEDIAEEEIKEEVDEEENDVPEEADELLIPPGDPPHQSEEGQPREENGAEERQPVEEASDSLPETAWREGIARKALEVEPPNAIPSEAAACVQLLRGVLARIVCGDPPTHEEYDTLDKAIEDFFRANADNPKGKKRSKEEVKKKTKKSYKHARTQELYRQNPGLLVKYVREGIDWTKEAKPNLGSEDIKSLYDYGVRLWGTKTHIKTPKFGEPGPPLELGRVLSPITSKDVRDRITRTKATVAAGLDGLTKRDVSPLARAEILRLWFNIIMARTWQPKTWRLNRTALLPKDGLDHTKVTNYRPITISSILSRLY
ncbi:uncharacterized protein LOC105194392 [Solenopsis invicta]|uniref:uncharacterized protein LOC105194392 n=1 Tax=Solenopsis invicta TaxID=13686 RepID=UPI00193DF6F2|nr:uncharacterized protein LOC105194392 [Solenopsis invicta]